MFRKQSPGKGQLAIRTGNWVGSYDLSLSEEHAYWAEEEERLAGTSNLAGHSLVQSIHSLLHEAGGLLMAEMRRGNFHPDDMDPVDREKIRRLSLGALGLARFFQCEGMLAADVSLDTLADGAAAQHANLLIDSANDDEGMPNDFGVHMPKPMANQVLKSEQTHCWFRDTTSGLWVYRTAAADPTDALLEQLAERGTEVDFAELTTVYPYMPTR